MSNFELETQVFAGYIEGQGLATRREALTASMQSLSRNVLDRIAVAGAGSPDFYVPIHDEKVNISASAVSYFESLAARNAVDDRLASLRASLSKYAVGETVAVSSLVDKKESVIGETYFERGIFGSHEQELSGRTHKKVSGTIIEVHPGDNVMVLSPVRGTNASINRGYYLVEVLDEGGNPQISIQKREPTIRDRPSRVGRIINAFFSPSYRST